MDKRLRSADITEKIKDIKRCYGDTETFRGKLIDEMSDAQIFMIWQRLKSKNMV